MNKNAHFSQRLKAARIMRGLSMEKLAALTEGKLTKQAIGKYEKGQSMPESENLAALAKALDVNLEYFFRPIQQTVTLSAPSYRKRRSLAQKQLNAINEKIRDHVERYLQIESIFPPERFPSLRLPELKGRQISEIEQVEDLANKVRTMWNLGYAPIDNLTEVLEDHHVIIVQIEGDKKFDGLSCWANNEIPIVVCKKVDTGDRQRSNIAHELGHLLIRADHINEEKAAQRFASALLVPEPVMYHELGQSRSRLGFEELHDLKHKYGMSLSMWVYRARALGIISESHAKAWFIELRKHNSLREPGNQVEIEEPQRFKRLVFQAYEEELITETKAAELLNWTIEQFRRKQMGELVRASHS